MLELVEISMMMSMKEEHFCCSVYYSYNNSISQLHLFLLVPQNRNVEVARG
ncbi:MAG: hypothetical protein WBI31_07990 [Thermacetogeniaceae bacterium]